MPKIKITANNSIKVNPLFTIITLLLIITKKEVF
jgi:hypothetical protein